MLRTLIVDDAALMRLRLKDILSKVNCEVVGEAANGKEAVELYEKLKPEMLTLDISMPEMNGIETLKKIMNIDPNAKVVIISAVGQKALIAEALRRGAKAFITKPFNSQQVVEKIEKLL